MEVTLVLCVLLVALAATYASIEVSKLKYRETAELGGLKKEVEALRAEIKKLDVKDFRDRLNTLENKAGVRLF